MSITLSALSDDAPSGEDLQYDPAFQALERAATPGQEKQVGNEIVPPDPIDFRDVAKKAEAILERSHDLRAGVFLAHARTMITGFEGLAETTGFLRACLEQFWDSCHPQLDEEDDNDPTMRVNAVRGLSDRNTILRAVRKAPLTNSKTFGRMSLHDIEVANGEASGSDDDGAAPTTAGIAAAFKDTDPEALLGIQRNAAEALDNIRAIDAVFDAQTPGAGPDLSDIIKLLQRIVQRMSEATGSSLSAAEEAPEDAPEASDGAAPGPAAARAPSGAIASSQDVTAALDRILAYYDTHEPSSPLPILIRRAKRLVGADFLTILKDIAPDGVDNVKLVGGVEADED